LILGDKGSRKDGNDYFQVGQVATNGSYLTKLKEYNSALSGFDRKKWWFAKNLYPQKIFPGINLKTGFVGPSR
jgi:hypothetical protein